MITKVYMVLPDGRREILDHLPDAVGVPGGTTAHVIRDDASESRFYRLLDWTSWQETILKQPLSRHVLVNRALKVRGEKSRLRRGKGYYYFDGEALAWQGGSSVATSDVSSLSVEDWLAEYDRMKAEAAR